MKLITYNADNTVSKQSPKLSIRKQGGVFLNKAAVDNFGLKAGDKIEFVNDEDSPREWYIKCILSDKGFELKDSKFNSLTFNSKVLTDAILDSIKFDHSAAMLLSSSKTTIDGNDYWVIVTGSAK